MPYPLTFALLALLLVLQAARAGGLAWLLLWPAASLLWLSLAYARQAPEMLGKQPDGRIAWPALLLLGPTLLASLCVWRIAVGLSRERAWDRVCEGLIIARRLRPGELEPGSGAVLDLTAELPEPRAIVAAAQPYVALPVLDACPPDAEALERAFAQLGDGPLVIHCAQGHGRTGFVAACWLLRRGEAASVDEALAQLQAARPKLALNAHQRRALEARHGSSGPAHPQGPGS